MNNTTGFDAALAAVLDEQHRAASKDWQVFLRGAPAAALGFLRGRGVEESMQPYLKDAYIPIDPRQGRVLYVLARAIGARTIVEFGASFGLSTLYLAAAARDNGSSRVISSELEETKRKRAVESLERAGLTPWAEVRAGDARQSLADVKGPIDLLFLDGWKDLYLPMLQLLEPKLSERALVLADDTKPFRRRLAPYLAHVREPKNGYCSLDLPLADGLEVSLRTGSAHER